MLTGSLARSPGEAVAGSLDDYPGDSGDQWEVHQAASTENTLNITPATLTVTADPQSKVYGATNPGFTASDSGYVNGDTGSVAQRGAQSDERGDGEQPGGLYDYGGAGQSERDQLRVQLCGRDFDHWAGDVDGKAEPQST